MRAGKKDADVEFQSAPKASPIPKPTKPAKSHHNGVFFAFTHRIKTFKPLGVFRNLQTGEPKTRQPRPPITISHSPCSLLLFIKRLLEVSLWYMQLRTMRYDGSTVVVRRGELPNRTTAKSHIRSKFATFVVRTV